MAVESKSTDCYFSLNEPPTATTTMTNNSNHNSSKSYSNSKSLEMSSKKNNQLNFYESMYHFKKMFPKFDCEVIETVLRANDGSVDKTIDQLLTMAADNELNEITSTTNAESSFNDSSFNFAGADLPPSYESLISSQTRNIQINAVAQTDKSKEENREYVSESVVIEDDSSIEKTNKIKHNEIDNVNMKKANKKLEDVPVSNRTSTLSSSTSSFASRFSNLMIGELSKDFLRIKLTSEQVKKIKTSIKKAKRNELTAILNNVPEKPDLSFEIKKKLNELKMDEKESDELMSAQFDESEKWKKRYDEITKTCEKRRLQILQDEYIAKLIQNEEFLNELRSDNDFIQTLNNESNSIRTSNPQMHEQLNNVNYNNSINIMSNAELKLKLGFMGKASRAKLSKLAAAFLVKAKNKYNKALDQTTITCTNLFTNFNTLKNIDYPPSTNNSYYISNSSNKSEDDAQFINSLKNLNLNQDSLVKLRNDGSYKLEDTETYNIDRIKAEEFNSSRFDTLSKNDSKYKKVYRSFKTAMKRNSSASSSSSSSLGSSISSNIYPNQNFNNNNSEFDNFKNQLPKINWDSSNNTISPDLITFKDDYSYDQSCNYFNSSIINSSKK